MVQQEPVPIRGPEKKVPGTVKPTIKVGESSRGKVIVESDMVAPISGIDVILNAVDKCDISDACEEGRDTSLALNPFIILIDEATVDQKLGNAKPKHGKGGRPRA
ncbi:hypothetical protein ACH5RR_023280 [Cinchona calisaya]|uniref:Uncharacterized protein n=1 Tax=Cinchona calisaya TaxID=153742 RepID=A0ABD2ZF76_9GENT